MPEFRTGALAGGGAMLAHDLVDRVTRDIDPFIGRDAEEARSIAAALRVDLAVGTVLHPDDLAADKVLAMWGPGEPRLRRRRRPPRPSSPGSAPRTGGGEGPGIGVETSGAALGAIRRIVPERWAAAGIGAERAGHVREVILAWRDRLEA